MKSVLLALFFILSSSAMSFATPLSVFTDGTWTEIAAEDTVQDRVYPGYGGQEFDAEYLFYKLEGSILSVGLQTGFDLADGVQTHDGKEYYAGDIALSFDGIDNGYEYAFDFGFYTEGYNTDQIAAVSAGLYEVTSWSTDVYSGYTVSNPFAMMVGSLDAAAINNVWGAGYTSTTETADYYSFYRWVTFDLAEIENLNFAHLDVHWTMSCGNDAIDGGDVAPVPEPSTFLLFAAGGGLVFFARRKRK